MEGPYDEAYDDGYAAGWNDCIKRVLEFLNDPSVSKAELAAGMTLALEANLE